MTYREKHKQLKDDLIKKGEVLKTIMDQLNSEAGFIEEPLPINAINADEDHLDALKKLIGFEEKWRQNDIKPDQEYPQNWMD